MCLCRSSQPYWDGQKCIGCEIPNYFDFTVQKCLSCLAGHYFNGKACALTNCSATYTFNIEKEECVCPWYSPLEKDGACHPCEKGQVFNKGTGQCFTCPSNSETTPDATACICKSSDQVFSWKLGECRCPYAAPVLDKDSGRCTACEGYYDAENNLCLDCPPGSHMIKN